MEVVVEGYEIGMLGGRNENVGIGADDRAGIALL